MIRNDDLRVCKINQQTKIDIFYEQLAEVIARAKGGRNPSELFGGNLGSMSSGGHFFFFLFFFFFFFFLYVPSALAKFQTHTENSALKNKNIDALIF